MITPGDAMQGLSAQTILQLWEAGQRQQSAERMVRLLAAALPDVPRAKLLSLCIGQRDTYLLTLRECTFGSLFTGYAECPCCHERTKCSFSAADIRVGAASLDLIGQTQRVQIGDYELELRLPTQADILAIATLGSFTAARAQLLQRCVLQAEHQSETIEVLVIPDEIITAVGEQMTRDDPQAEVLLTLSCPTCEQSWTVLFDIGAWLWTEIATHAKRLLREVHTLALAYGWSEADILAMSALLRQCYLEMVS